MVYNHRMNTNITRDDIKRVIGQYQGLTTAQIATHLNCQTSDISSSLTDMTNRNQITRTRPISIPGKPQYPYQYYKY